MRCGPQMTLDLSEELENSNRVEQTSSVWPESSASLPCSLAAVETHSLVSGLPGSLVHPQLMCREITVQLSLQPEQKNQAAASLVAAALGRPRRRWTLWDDGWRVVPRDNHPGGAKHDRVPDPAAVIWVNGQSRWAGAVAKSGGSSLTWDGHIDSRGTREPSIARYYSDHAGVPVSRRPLYSM